MMNERNVIGIDLGGSNVKAGIVNEDNIREIISITSPASGSE